MEALKATKVVAVSCGLAHTAALDANGNVYTFGFARSWLGHGDWHEASSRPCLLAAAPRSSVPVRISLHLLLCFIGSGCPSQEEYKLNVVIPRKVEALVEVIPGPS